MKSIRMDLMAAFPREHRFKGLLFDYPSLVFTTVVVYIAIVLKFGPDYMRDRRPYNVRGLTRVYNILQVKSISRECICRHHVDNNKKYVA